MNKMFRSLPKAVRLLMVLFLGFVLVTEPVFAATPPANTNTNSQTPADENDTDGGNPIQTALKFIDRWFFTINDIVHWDPEEAREQCDTGALGATAGSSGSVTLTGDTIEEQVWNFFIGKGFTPQQVAGIMGNIEAESAFNPAVVERGSGIGFGLAQWSFGRRTALENAAAAQGVSPSDVAFQLGFLYQEMESRRPNGRFPKYSAGYSNEVEALKGQATVNDALVAFHHNFERSHLLNSSNPDQAVINSRGGVTTPSGKRGADWFYNNFAGGGAGIGAAGGGGGGWDGDCLINGAAAGGASTAATGDFIATVKGYAWPDWRGFGYQTRKPEYAAAIDAARGQGRYIGGCNGVDCGGFVTTLMIDSGFEPNYNYTGKGGNTVVQRRWVDENWTILGLGSQIDTSTLQAGDVAFYPGHTYVYVGPEAGFQTNVAGSSLCSYAPMSAVSVITAGNTTWYRKR